MNRIWQKVKKFFSPKQQEKAKGDVKFSKTILPKTEKKDDGLDDKLFHRLRRSKTKRRKYRRYVDGKHPLHHAHCGTFSPVPRLK